MKNSRPDVFAPSPSTARRRAALQDAVVLVEDLEPRRMLAVISGTIWNDVDNNGLKDFFEDGLPGVNVFLDANQNRQFDAGERTTTTDAQGNYRFRGLDVDPDEGTTYYVYRSPTVDGIDGTFGATSPGIGGRSNAVGNFNIDIVYADNNLSDELKTVIETAIDKWEEVILGDVPDVGEIDDLQILVKGQNVDGPFNVLAFAAPTAFRDPGSAGDVGLTDFRGTPVGLPYQGEITVDLADSRADRAFVETVTHEIGHVLGIGSLWDSLLSNRGSPTVSYVGPNAIAQDSILFDRDLDSLPVEPRVEGHWSEASYGDELMTPFAASGGFGQPVENGPFAPLSRMTVGALADFGWEVNYGGSEPYGPFGIGPLPTDGLGTSDLVPFEIGAYLATADSVVDDANFGMRLNNDPAPFFFQAGPAVQQAGEDVRLLATIDTSTDSDFSGDADFRDSLVQINFYRETNDVEGLQTGEGGDELLFEDADPSGGFDIFTSTSGFPVGEQIFYARGFDQAYATVDRALVVTIVDNQTAPAAASSLQAVGTTTGNILVNFLDNSVDESGFLLEASTSPNFDVPADIKRVYLPPSEGTGAVAYDYAVNDGAVSTRYFRVRSYNTAGATKFTDQVTARTLSRGEILVDNDSAGVTVDGFTRVVSRPNSVNGTYLSGTSGSVDFDPNLSSFGNYFVFVRSVAIAEPGSVLVDIFGGDGALLRTVSLDQSQSAGADVLLGTYALGADSHIRVRQNSGTATADTVRLLPAG